MTDSIKYNRKQQVLREIQTRVEHRGLIETNPIPSIFEIGLQPFLLHFQFNVMVYFENSDKEIGPWVSQITSNGLLHEPALKQSIADAEDRLNLKFDRQLVEFLEYTNGFRLPGPRWVGGVEQWMIFSSACPDEFAFQMKEFSSNFENQTTNISDAEYLNYENRNGLGTARIEYLPHCICLTESYDIASLLSYKDDGYVLLNPKVINEASMEVWDHSSWDDWRYPTFFHYLQSAYQTWMDELYENFGD